MRNSLWKWFDDDAPGLFSMNPFVKIRTQVGNRVIRTSEKILNNRVSRPIPCDRGRMKLARLLPDGGTGIELGVAAGYFSDALLRCSNLARLFSIDAWADHHDSDEYLLAVRRLAKHGNRSVVLRMFFDDAIGLFDDETIDFVYLDAYAHAGQENGKLLDHWWRKLRPGGLFAGHDYDLKWPKTVEAVDAFCDSKDIEPSIISGVRTANHQDSYASWYVFKND
ncbi:class I SAM-dependent methyltransferase [Wenzhouxiangella sp. EGI_FJ10305]|uniref:class I SAM-dependent methyltransferase n=1 Tax=Wenzhouxiangella sp. EGI_FJ10305 TaxID=3243768 RepID=UPI0035D76BAC